MRKLHFIFLCLFISTSSLAASRGGRGGSGHPGPQNGLRLDFGAGLGKGTGQSSDGVIPSRATTETNFYLGTGFHTGFLSPVVYGLYDMVTQSSDAATVKNQDVSGSGYMLGLGGRFAIHPFFFQAGYHFYGSYTLKKQTSLGADSVYSNPAGYLILIGYKIAPRLTALISSLTTDYNKSAIGGTSADMTNNKFTLQSYGIGFLFAFY